MLFSNHFINNSATYKLIGSINKNIIVWTINDRNSSEILVFDNELHLLRKVSSGILKSDVDANPEYFSLADSFAVAYQYKFKNTWQYRLTFFDDNATQLSTIIVDSLDSDKAKTESGKYFYKSLVSQDKKTICCTKFLMNVDSAVIKISCTFIKNGEVSYEQFFLPFDFLHESIDNFSIDGNKNFVVLETLTSDSSFFVKLIKKNFLEDYLLITSKKIDSGSLINGSIHLTYKPDTYIIYGAWQNNLNTAENKNLHLTGFFKWTTDFNLNDKPGDTILNITTATNWNINFIKSEKDRDLFAIEKYKRDTSIHAEYVEAYDNSSWQNELMRSVDLGSLPHISEVDQIELDIANHYRNYLPPPSDQVSGKSVVNTIETGVNIFSLSNSNQLNWLKDLGSSSTQFLQSLNNKVIASGTNTIHIIYSHQLTNSKMGISQIIVSDEDGTYNVDNLPIWNSSYVYLMEQAVAVDNNTIIIPCFKGKKIFLGKLMFE
ncbi:MAG TPA: hypothetical protein VHB70_08015 [Parafilimonas sp.]|nr:hypothetical protein [Parafilimonas sp.]